MKRFKQSVVGRITRKRKIRKGKKKKNSEQGYKITSVFRTMLIGRGFLITDR